MSSASLRALQEREDTLTAIAESAHGFANARAAWRARCWPARTPDAALTHRRRRRRRDDPRRRRRTRRDRAAARRRTTRLPALLRALDGRFIAPVAGGDLMRTPAILPTGRNLHGFDPYRIPSAFAVADGRRQAERVLAALSRRRSRRPRDGRRGAVGRRQSQERRRPDRPGARAGSAPSRASTPMAGCAARS